MHCPDCGERLLRSSSWCAACAAWLAPRERLAPLVRATAPIFVLRPEVVPEVLRAAELPVVIFLSLWGGAFFGAAASFLLAALGLAVPTWPLVCAAALLLLVGLPFLGLRAARRALAEATHAFHASRMELSSRESNPVEVHYREILSVTVERGPVQARHGLGTLLLRLRRRDVGTGGFLRLTDVRDPERAAERLRGLLELPAAATPAVERAA